ncbi:MAG: hypothetical protein IJP61_00585 [Treponema sp.]|nr:hypothetical protein [Treponema sp.]
MASSLKFCFFEEFSKSYLYPFTEKDLKKLLAQYGIKVSQKELYEYLETEPFIFPLEKKYFITRAGAFTDKIFSIFPTWQEVEQKCFAAGDRCIPFVNFELLPNELKFEFMGQILPSKILETDCNTARELFTLYGDEYAVQYIASDPVNKKLRIIENGCELSGQVKLTGVSIEEIIRLTDFKFGDRFLCRVKDWAEGIVEIFPFLYHTLTPVQQSSQKFAQAEWFETLEEAMLKSFDRIGPCATMEEQLAKVFYENRKTLCVPDCASIHEFLRWSEKVRMQLFGVETRLWRRGEEIPAVGRWNENMIGNLPCQVKNDIVFAPDFLIDCYLKDTLFEKKNDFSTIINKILPAAMNLTTSEKDYISLQIQNRSAIIRNQYNWFADFAFGAIRHRALQLFKEVELLMSELDFEDGDVHSLPQTELIVLSQLYAHIFQMLETLSAENEKVEDEELSAMELSVEGMEFKFEEIRLPLISAMNRIRGKKFAVI